MAKVYEIDENTKLPARVVYGLLLVTVGATIWLTSAQARIASVENTVSEINSDQKETVAAVNGLKVEIMELKTLIKAQNKGR